MPQVRRVGYLLSAILAAALITAAVWKPAPPPRFQAISASALPVDLDGYHGADTPVDGRTLRGLPSAQIFSRDYEGAGGPISFVMIGGTDRDALHDPRSCLVGDGWRLDNDRVEKLPAGGEIRACEAYPAGGGADAGRSDIVYLYVTDGGVLASATAIRMKLLESALLEQKGKPVFFLRFIRHVPGTMDDPGRQAEHRQLLQFASAMWQRMSPVIMKGSGI